MAKYEYSCITCDTTVEIERPMADPEGIYVCETCGYNLVRVYAAPGIHFKGGGFYSTGG